MENNNNSSFSNNLINAGINTALYLSSCKIYDKIFKRYERPDYRLKPGICCLERVKENLNPQKISFYSDNVKLSATLYNAKNPKALVVICHGLHSGGDDYLPIAVYFFNKGFSVFSFNYKGTYESQGNSTVGMCESLVDTNHCLDFIQSNPELSSLPVMILGHSWGGYAAGAVLNLHKEIKASAIIAGFNDAYNLIYDKGVEYTDNTPAKLVQNLLSKNKTLSLFSDFAFNSPKITKDFLEKYQTKLFGAYTRYTALQGVNSTQIPVLAAHGDNDIVINKYRQSLFAYKDSVTNKNVIWYDGKNLQGGHDTIWHSERSQIYRQKIKNELKELEKQKEDKLSPQEKIEYYKNVDHELYSEINKNLFDEIYNMFCGGI